MTRTLELRSGGAIPVVGLGVYQTPPGEPTRRAVRAALDAGYRHIDTARIYDNEEDVGRAIAESRVPRDQLFVTTKLWNADHGHDRARRACEASLRRLGLDYVDLYLIHWPVHAPRVTTWRTFVELRDEGKCRAIGVSNYTARHLDELAGASNALPDVNQIELHPWGQQRDVARWCTARGVVVEAYSPLSRGERLSDTHLATIARAHDKTPAQILIRWGIQHGYVSLPKSVRPARIAENLDVFGFTLTDAEMTSLDTLDEGLHTCWDPTDEP
jgi:methylglyoxal/glyoxal reductase